VLPAVHLPTDTNYSQRPNVFLLELFAFSTQFVQTLYDPRAESSRHTGTMEEREAALEALFTQPVVMPEPKLKDQLRDFHKRKLRC
jgi:hypothetical protein